MKIGELIRILLLAALPLLCLLFTAGCAGRGDIPDTPPIRTILFYMGGDNDLSGEVAEKLDALRGLTVPPGVCLLVYTDRRNETPRLLEAGNGKTSIVREYAESNSASAGVFADVLREAAGLYLAPSYGLILFSHASGWLPEGTYANPGAYTDARRADNKARSLVTDGKAEMEITAFAAAIPAGMLDFIIFEACHMAGIETVYELKDKTRYIVASSAEIVSPGFTPAYAEAMPCLFGPEADLQGFCRKIDADYRTRGGDYASLTLGLIRTAGVENLAATIKTTFPAGLLDSGISVADNGEHTIQSFDRYGKRLFFDFGDWVARIAPGNHHSLQSAIGDCVVWKTATRQFMPAYGGFEVNAHSGLTTYIPQEQYPNLNEAYKQLKWYGEINY